MSYLLETLGRGLLSRIADAFQTHFPASPDESSAELADRFRASPTSYDLALRLGAARLRNVRLRDAEAAFHAARDLGADRPAPLVGLACICDERGDIQGALEWLEQAVGLDSQDPAIHYAIGMCHERLGNPNAADDAYARARRACAILRNAHERSAALAVVRRDWRAAADRYVALTEASPDDLDALLTLATLRLLDGDAEASVELFQRALLIEPDTVGEGDYPPADPNDEDALRDAIATYEELVSRHPGVIEFHVHLADLYVQADEDEAALEQYRLALEHHPTLLEATVKIGTQHLRRGRHDQAAQAFSRAAELNDRLLVAFAGLGVAQHAAGRNAEALATFDLAAGLAPNSSLLLAESTRLRVKAVRGPSLSAAPTTRVRTSAAPAGIDEHLAWALEHHQERLRSRPHDADLHYRYGMLARHVGDFPAALTSLREATRINPSFSKAQIMLGVALRETGDGYGSIEAFRRAILPDEHSVELHYQVALAFSRRTHFDLALLRAEDDPDCDPALRPTLNLALQTVGMIDRMAATWSATCALAGDPPCFSGAPRITDEIFD